MDGTKQVVIEIIETTSYLRVVELADLEAEAGMTFEDIKQLKIAESFTDDQLLQELVDYVHNVVTPGFQEYLERHGEVQGQEWKAKWAVDE